MKTGVLVLERIGVVYKLEGKVVVPVLREIDFLCCRSPPVIAKTAGHRESKLVRSIRWLPGAGWKALSKGRASSFHHG